VSDRVIKTDENGEKLEDILSSIRSMIENQNPISYESSPDDSYEYESINNEGILELTTVVEASDFNSSDALIASDVQAKTESEFKRFAQSVASADIKHDKSDSFDDKVNQIMRPLIKDWLDNNLPKVVKKIVSEEIKRIIPKS
jgi:uncharacterized protein